MVTVSSDRILHRPTTYPDPRDEYRDDMDLGVLVGEVDTHDVRLGPDIPQSNGWLRIQNPERYDKTYREYHSSE